MRACFLGQNVCALGFGVATLQSPPLVVDEETGKPKDLWADADGRTRPARYRPRQESGPCNNSATKK